MLRYWNLGRHLLRRGCETHVILIVKMKRIVSKTHVASGFDDSQMIGPVGGPGSKSCHLQPYPQLS
jgi:hypothetical protein